MSLIKWSDTFSVKIQSIDEQHRKLFNMINDLNNAIKENNEKEKIGIILKDLISYTKSHFVFEENMMIKHDYHGYKWHKTIHDDLIFEVSKIVKRFDEGQDIVAKELLNFLLKWLVEHIGGVDKQYSPIFSHKEK